MKNNKLIKILAPFALLLLTAIYYMIVGRDTTPDTVTHASTVSISETDIFGENEGTGDSTANIDVQNSSSTDTVNETVSISSSVETSASAGATEEAISYKFRSKKLLKDHYEKHGIEMGFDSQESYEAAASAVINNPDALSKTEKEDGDYVYYVEETNEFVILSTDGYIRTYFLPSAGIKYYNKQ